MGLNLNAAPTASKKPIRKQDTEKLAQEVRDLKRSLKSFQERLILVVEQLGTEKEYPTKSTPLIPKANLWELPYFSQFVQHIKIRVQEFLIGLESVAQTLMHPSLLQRPFANYLLCFSISFGVGLFLIFLGRTLLVKRIQSFLESAPKSTSLSKLSVVSVFLLVPLGGAFAFSMVTALLLEFFSISKTAFRSTNCALFPLDLYILWAGFTWISVTFYPSRPSKALIPVDPYGAHQGAFCGRAAFLLWFLGKLILTILEVFPLSILMARAISDLMGVFVIITLWRGLSVVRRHLVPSSQTAYIVRGIFLIKGLILGFCGIWLFGRTLLSYSLVPLLVTGVGLLLIHPLKRLFRRWRLQFLWKRRHQKMFLRSLFKSQATFDKIVSYLIYGVLGCLWIMMFWTDEASVISLLLFWMKTPFMGRVLSGGLVVLGAIFLVKGLDRILKYYVEEKYATDTQENNFLASRLKTLMAMLKTFLRIIVWAPAIGIILAQLGWNIETAWVTSIGAVSFALTFGLQSIVRDFVTGFFIIIENNLMVGDEVEVDQRKGKVEAIALRTLKVRSDDGILMTIPFGHIGIIGNKSRDFSAIIMNISVAYKEDLDRVQSLIEKAFLQVRRTPFVGRRVLGALEIRGVNEVTSYSVVFQIKIKTTPSNQDLVRRTFNKILKTLFDEAGIVVPTSPHMTMRASPSLTNTIVS
jgi:small-conductance mechanosensitive channel